MIPNNNENENVNENEVDETVGVEENEDEIENEIEAEYEKDNPDNINPDEDSDLLESEEFLENRFITIGQNQKQTLYFLRGFDTVMQKPRIRPIEKEYQGKKMEKAHFDVFTATDIMDGKVTENKIKWFDTGKRSGRLIYSEVKEHHQLLDIKHVGEGKETMYVPSVNSNPQLLKAVAKLKTQLQELQPRRLNGE
jgi:hypothetical protein